jgi:pre-rRNA-processing protein IPI3
MIKPPDLIGHTSLDFRIGTVDTKDIIPVKPVMPFQRMRDAKARDAHEVIIMLPSHNTVRLFSFPFQMALHLYYL